MPVCAGGMKTAVRSSASKRELINIGTEKRYMRCDEFNLRAET